MTFLLDSGQELCCPWNRYAMIGLMWNGTNLRASVRLCSLFNLPVVRRKMSAQHRFSTFTPQQNTQEAKHSVCVSACVSVWMFMWRWTVQVRWRRQRGGAACLCGKSKCCSVWPMWTFFLPGSLVSVPSPSPTIDLPPPANSEQQNKCVRFGAHYLLSVMK